MKHFWLLKSRIIEEIIKELGKKDYFSVILRKNLNLESYYLELKKDNWQNFLKECLERANITEKKELCYILSKLSIYKVRLFYSNIRKWFKGETVPLWFVKIMALLYATKNLDTLKYCLLLAYKTEKSPGLELEIHKYSDVEKKLAEIFKNLVPKKRKVAMEYYSKLLDIEEYIEKIRYSKWGRPSIKNIFPFEINERLAIIFARLLFSRIEKDYVTSYSSRHENIISKLNEDCKEFFLASLKISPPYGGSIRIRFPSTIITALSDCFPTFKVGENAPEEIYKVSPEIKKEFIKAIYDECGTSFLQYDKHHKKYYQIVRFASNIESILLCAQRLLRSLGYKTGKITTRGLEYIKLDRKFSEEFVDTLLKDRDKIHGLTTNETTLGIMRKGTFTGKDLRYLSQQLTELGLEKFSMREIIRRKYYVERAIPKRYQFSIISSQAKKFADEIGSNIKEKQEKLKAITT